MAPLARLQHFPKRLQVSQPVIVADFDQGRGGQATDADQFLGVGKRHLVYRKRCERDGLELKGMGMGEDDIEPDWGQAAVLQQPSEIRIRPLNETDQDDRVRLALGLTGDEPLPEVDEETLRAYHSFLAAHLTFPFEANWEPEYGPAQTVKIAGLGDPEDIALVDEMYDPLCDARAG